VGLLDVSPLEKSETIARRVWRKRQFVCKPTCVKKEAIFFADLTRVA